MPPFQGYDLNVVRIFYNTIIPLGLSVGSNNFIKKVRRGSGIALRQSTNPVAASDARKVF